MRDVSPAPEPRRGAVDVARAGSLLFVVAGHLLLAVIDRAPGGGVRGANLLVLEPSLRWLALASPMAVFFVAAGWASASSGVGERDRQVPAAGRVRPLVLVSFVVTCAWGSVAAAEQVLTGGRGVLTDGARIATQPLWFLAAYVPFSLSRPVLGRAARRPVLWCAACTVSVGAADVLRFVAGAPR